MPIHRRHVIGCGCAALALAGCQTTAEGPVAPGYRPSAATDEGGLWAAMDKAEAELKRSRFLIRDAELNAYVSDIACRLAGDHCRDMRIYIVRTPHFNATMAPNGKMEVWSGLLLRARNEAQLAAILGHEIAHYRQRHTINNWRNARNAMDVSVFLGLGLALAGVPAGSMVQLLALASVFSYNRDQEREADDIGIELMAKAGYNPIEASRVWEQLIAEQTADGDELKGNVLFATHPESRERAETLRARAAGLAEPGQSDGTLSYTKKIRGIRAMMFEDELKLRRFSKTLVLLDRLAGDLPQDGDVQYFYGELYRLRDETGDPQRARTAYERAIAMPQPPAEAWRGLGLVLRKAGDRAGSHQALERYLLQAPNAPDRALIQSYMVGV